MRRLTSNSLQRTLVVLLLLMTIPALLIQLLLHLSATDSRRQVSLQENLQMASTVARSLEAYINHVVDQEKIIGKGITLLEPFNAGRTTELLQDGANASPAIRELSWLGPDGKVISSTSMLSVGMTFRAEDLLGQISGDRQWAVSNLLNEPFGGGPAFVVASGTRDNTGTLLGFVVAVIDTDRLGGVVGLADQPDPNAGPAPSSTDVLNTSRADSLTDRHNAAEWSPDSGGGSITIVDATGMGIIRFPGPPMSWEERNWTTVDPLMETAIKGQEVTVSTVSPVDGERRLVSLAPLHSMGWVVRAARPEDEVMGDIARNVLVEDSIHLVFGLMGVIAIFVLSKRVTGPITRLEKHALTIGAGGLTTRVEIEGPLELQKLGEAFNVMAEEIEIREARLTKAFAALQEHALIDELTGLYNRRGFDTLAGQQMKLAARGETRPAIYFIDMDGLKAINDNLGHAEGDKALEEIAIVLRDSFRSSDIVARLGGDEFVIMALSGAGNREAALKRLDAKIKEHNLLPNRNFRLMISLGMAEYDPDTGQSLEQLLQTADERMYHQKKQKPNRSPLLTSVPNSQIA